MCTLPPFLLGGEKGVEPLTNFAKRGVLYRISIFRGGLLCYKNLNWEILTKNLVTFERWDGVKGEKF